MTQTDTSINDRTCNFLMADSDLMRFTILLFVTSMLAGCGDYYHYGLKRGSSASTLEQNDPFYITGDYEFKSILYQSSDGNLTITVQHPIHPIPEPEIFISQIQFEQKEVAASFSVKDVTFWHKRDDGSLIEPIEKTESSNRPGDEGAFYILKYSRESLSKKLIEHVGIEFSYDGISQIIIFDETVELMKRWNRAAVAISS